MPDLSSLLAAASLAASGAFWACLAASLRRFRDPADAPADLPMTLIKPVRGLDDAMEASFRSIVAADPLKVLQVIVALESDDDPAFPVARAFAAAHPDRDVLVLLTGPAGARMGKAHNMIEALKAAKHPRVLFSDADTSITPALLRETARAFREGADAVFGLPYHADAPGFGGWCFMVAFNHSYCVPAALAYEAGQFRSFAGAWMGYTKETLAKVGGLEPFSRSIADDFALGMAARGAGARLELLREPVFVSESGTRPAEAFWHVAKWASIICWSFPLAWLLAPFVNPVMLALAAVAAAFAAGASSAPGLVALGAAFATRALVGLIQDRRVGRIRRPAWTYLALLGADLGAVVFWPLGLRRTIEWRGRRYR
ncbi:MAG: glycosyltransferase, partial [Elusimicrobiota bacterium]|nr:glycosyltransferase [Elusimicrobiota bacterium]